MFRKAAFILAIGAGLAPAACGGGPPNAADIYADAGEKMAALTSYHLTGEELEEGRTQPDRFEADIVPPDRVRITVTATEDGESFEFTFIAIGDQSYFSPPESPDFFISPEEGEFGISPEEEGFGEFGDILAFLTALYTEISDLTYLDEEDVDGVSTHHLQGTLPPEVLEIVEPQEQHTESVRVELWIGVEDSLL